MDDREDVIHFCVIRIIDTIDKLNQLDIITNDSYNDMYGLLQEYIDDIYFQKSKRY